MAKKGRPPTVSYETNENARELNDNVENASSQLSGLTEEAANLRRPKRAAASKIITYNLKAITKGQKQKEISNISGKEGSNSSSYKKAKKDNLDKTGLSQSTSSTSTQDTLQSIPNDISSNNSNSVIIQKEPLVQTNQVKEVENVLLVKKEPNNFNEQFPPKSNLKFLNSNSHATDSSKGASPSSALASEARTASLKTFEIYALNKLKKSEANQPTLPNNLESVSLSESSSQNISMSDKPFETLPSGPNLVNFPFQEHKSLESNLGQIQKKSDNNLKPPISFDVALSKLDRYLDTHSENFWWRNKNQREAQVVPFETALDSGLIDVNEVIAMKEDLDDSEPQDYVIGNSAHPFIPVNCKSDGGFTPIRRVKFHYTLAEIEGSAKVLQSHTSAHLLFQFRSIIVAVVIRTSYKLGLPINTINRALRNFHSFYLFKAKEDFSPMDMALSCISLAGKEEDTFKKLDDIIAAGQYTIDHHFPNASMIKIFPEQKSRCLELEKILLSIQCYKFDFVHPTDLLFEFMSVLSLGSTKATKLAFDLINERFQTCLRFPAQVIACGALTLASLIADPASPLAKTKDWYTRFVCQSDTVNQFCSSLLEDLLATILLVKNIEGGNSSSLTTTPTITSNLYQGILPTCIEQHLSIDRIKEFKVIFDSALSPDCFQDGATLEQPDIVFHKKINQLFKISTKTQNAGTRFLF